LGIRLRLAFVLVDETFGLTVRAANEGVTDLVAYKTAADAMLYSAFLLGTIVGAWFGAAIDPVAMGIDVLFALLFLGLAAPMVKVRRDWVVAAAAVLASILAAMFLPAAWQITSAAIAAAAVGMALGE
jgi:predicted branched-subunit amino acid permease